MVVSGIHDGELDSLTVGGWAVGYPTASVIFSFNEGKCEIVCVVSVVAASSLSKVT